MSKRLLSIAVLFLLTFGSRGFAQVRNSGFSARGAMPPYLTQATVENYRKAGWKCPDVADWPQWWGVYGNPGTIEFPRAGGAQADGYARLGGTNVFLTGYHGLPLENRNYVYTMWARGKGNLRFHVLSYGKAEDGRAIQLFKEGEAAVDKIVSVNSKEWVRYRHLLVKTPPLWTVHPWVGVEEGVLDIDDVDIMPSTPALDLIVQEEEKLYGAGAFIENLDLAQADGAFMKKRQEYEAAAKDFQAKSATLDKNLVESMLKEQAALNPYVLTAGITTVQVPCYNEMIALTRVLKRLAGKEVAGAEQVVATAVKGQSAEGYKSGVRQPRPNTITITEIKPNKILYKENDAASAVATIVSKSAVGQKGTLVAFLHLDLDTVRELKRNPVTLAAGSTQTWNIIYNVGPETFGRGIEVQFIDGNGKLIDTWQEFYQVAAEWLRVQMHTCGRYWNMTHYFAGEPTDFGVHTPNVEQYIAGQPGYHVNIVFRQNQLAYLRQKGMNSTFYQNQSFGGIMGYEEMRKHPEYALYDKNGQFGVDPVYGGSPNPMELASPMEIGPKRKPAKPYLNRMMTPWQHCSANFANPEVVEYFVRCVKQYAKENHFDGMYLDDAPSARRGYSYDGTTNLPRDRNEIALLNARLARIYQGILREDNPDFGTWFNHGYAYPGIMRRIYGPDALLGSGISDDDSDVWIRALTEWKNTSCLMEWSGTFRGSEGQGGTVKNCYDGFIANRDYIVQRYGCNAIVGYIGTPGMDHKNPGPSKWSWPTINYFMALGTASQQHLRLEVPTWEGTPSLEPEFQFQTRFSRFLWAPDIKVAPVDEVNKTVALASSEKIWWDHLVYRRDTADGYDLIIHLVRIPPYVKWDLKWVDEPAPLAGVKVTTDLGAGKVKNVFACRPYHFDEDQQVVEKTLKAEVADSKAIVDIPPFRYHTMLVMRVKN